MASARRLSHRSSGYGCTHRETRARTAANLVANASLVRLSFVADLLQALVWLCLAVLLYRLLARAGRNLARAMVIFVVVSVGIATLNMVHQLGALLVCPRHRRTGPPSGTPDPTAWPCYSWTFTTTDTSSRSSRGYGCSRSACSATVWHFPRPLAFVLMLGTICYAVDALVQFLAPGAARTSAAVFVLPETLSEVALLLYLLIKGVRTPKPATLAPPSP